MIGRHGPALAFWLSYLDHEGGLWEQSGDTVLAIPPVSCVPSTTCRKPR